MVFIFAKSPSDGLASLAKAVDKVVAKNKAKKLSAVINLIGQPTDAYLAKAKAFAKENKLENVVVTVTGDADKFNVSDDAEVTVMHYSRKTVKFNLAVDKDGLNEKTVKAVIGGVDKILN